MLQYTLHIYLGVHMQAYFEYLPFFGTTSEKVKLPQLAVDNSLHQFQLESKKYFTIDANAEATNGNKLAITPVVLFNIDTPEQINFIERATKKFTDASTALKAIDSQIAQSLLLSVNASAVTILPFLGTVGWVCSWIGLGYAVKKFADRQLAYQDYNESMTLLMGTCNWSLGVLNTSAPETITNHPAVKSMLNVLYPVLTKKQIECLIADEIESGFVASHQQEQDKSSGYFSTFFGSYINPHDKTTFGKIGTNISHSAYGFGKGSPMDTLLVMFTSIPDIFRAVSNGFSDVMKKWNAPQQETSSATLSH